MRRGCLIVFLLALTMPDAAVGEPGGPDTARLPGNIRIAACSRADLDALLPVLQRRFPQHSGRLAALARMYVGAPYVPDPMPDERADWLPYRKTNCTMFVLYTAAFANSASFAEALEHMRMLHYRRGAVGYKTRYHFTADRITDPSNRYFTAITEQCVRDPSALSYAALMLNKTKSGGFFFGGRLENWSRRVRLAYVPRAGFSLSLLRELPEALGVALVKRKNWDKGIIAGHEGLLIGGDLYHSSPSAGVCISRDYLASAFPGSPWEGIIFFTINSVRLPEHERPVRADMTLSLITLKDVVLHETVR